MGNGPQPNDAFARPKWHKPAPLGHGEAMQSVGGVASPLLAGFSLAAAISTAGKTDGLRWPGLAILALTMAAILLIGSIQFSFIARQYIWSPNDVKNWWPDMHEGTPREIRLRDEQARSLVDWMRWSSRMRISYNSGIVLLLGGLGSALAPDSDAAQPVFRWAATGFAFGACAGESWWIARTHSNKFSTSLK